MYLHYAMVRKKTTAKQKPSNQLSAVTCDYMDVFAGESVTFDPLHNFGHAT
jgi:hypothetical protein